MKIKKMILWVYFLLRLPVIYCLKLLFPASRRAEGGVTKILLIRIDRLGDFILSLPVIDNLRLRYPDAEITVVIRPYLKELAGLIKNIDRVLICGNFLSTAKKLRGQKFDLAIDLVCDYRLDAAFLAFISAAPVRAGFKGGFREMLFSHSIDAAGFPYKNMAQLHLELLKPLDIPVVVTEPRIDLESRPQGEFVIAFHPGGYYSSQRWPAERFILLGKEILERYKVRLAVVGAAGDKQLVDYIVSGINDGSAFAELKGLKDLAVFLSGCKLLVCNNSGPLHLAAALRVPTVSMMGPTNPVLWYPMGNGNIVIRKEDGKGCAYLDLISVEEVLEAVKKQMDKAYGIDRH